MGQRTEWERPTLNVSGTIQYAESPDGMSKWKKREAALHKHWTLLLQVHFLLVPHMDIKLWIFSL
jgi:hypothetical protein